MQNTSRRENVPGLSKVKSSLDDFKKSKTHENVNPTMQNAQEALPVVEKSVEFREGRAGVSIMPQWLTPEVVKVAVSVESAMPEISADVVDKPMKSEKPVKKSVSKKTEQIKNIETIKPKAPKVEPLSDLEIVMNNNTVINKEKQPDVFDTMSFASVVPEVKQEQPQEVNVFENLNTMQPIEVEKQQDNKQTLLSAKPIMVVDKVEIRCTTNENGETIYMIGKKEASQNEFDEYMQSVRGKIIALDCKKLIIGENVYTKQNTGNYKDMNNNMLSVDEVLNLLH